MISIATRKLAPSVLFPIHKRRRVKRRNAPPAGLNIFPHFPMYAMLIRFSEVLQKDESGKELPAHKSLDGCSGNTTNLRNHKTSKMQHQGFF
ncbi:hypothetical protein VTK73DRAFT_7944 [Phialemonium thermophilum]|uniref:Uncharacterized protein n=1 Tax=Phialemonium thermophilum TaxID=223376 RepID=A0ABR3XS00_9PEZI